MTRPQRSLSPSKPEQLSDAVLRDLRHEAVSAGGPWTSHEYPSAPGSPSQTVGEQR